MSMRLAGHVLVKQLEIQGVRDVFCVPGESFLPVLDGLHDSSIRTVVCRHEGAAGMMAEAAGKLEGRPGVVMVTRGPGATNVAHAVHVAEQDSTPLIVFVGLIPRSMKGRGAFQEIDLQRLFGGMAKWVVDVDDGRRIPEILTRAFHTAMQGRPGPVVIGLPEDMLSEEIDVADGRLVENMMAPAPGGVASRFVDLLTAARRPVFILGGSSWNAAASATIAEFAEAFDVPVACQVRRQSLFNAEHPNYVGDLSTRANPDLVKLIRESDLVTLIGGRMSEVPSQNYTLFDIPNPRQSIVHVHPDAGELGRVYHPELAVHATAAGFAEALLQTGPWNRQPRSARTEVARQAYIAFSDQELPMPGDVQMADIVRFLRARLPADTIMCNGAGNYTGWLQRIYRFREFRTQLAPISGSMGYGLPAAIAAKLHHPDRLAIAFAGDGCFLMTGQELATAVQYRLAVIVVVVDNGMYGAIRMHQEKEFPARVIATDLHNPDFASLARSYGAHGESVNATDEFEPAFERAIASGKPAVIHCRISGEALTPTSTVSSLRAASR